MASAVFDKGELNKQVGLILTSETLEHKIPMMGTPLERIEGNEIEFEIFPNRPELLSVEGFSRALRHFLRSEMYREYEAEKGKIELKVEKVPARPYIVGAVVRNIKIDDLTLKSLMQFQEKMHQTFGRNRQKVAIGVHDFDKVKPPFTYKAVKPESVKFIPLDFKEEMSLREITQKHPKGKDYGYIVENSDKWPLLVDAQGAVLSFPPIINGELTKVTTNTKNIFIDITGTSETAIRQSLNILCCLLADRGGTVESLRGDKNLLQVRKMKLDLDYASKLLDIDLKPAEVETYLNRMGLDFVDGQAIIPPYRTDIMHPMDLVEEIAIAYGYEKFQPELPRVPTTAIRDPRKEIVEGIRESMIGLGFQEVATFILSNKDDQFIKMNVSESLSAEVANPKTELYSICRKWLAPSMMKTFSENKHREFPQNIFEIGEAITADGKEHTKLAVGMCNTSVGYENISSILNSFMRSFGLQCVIRPMEHNSFLQGRVGEISVNGRPCGFVGEVSPAVISNWQVDNPVAMFEINIDEIFKPAN